jgi:glycosyltransferase involved in cell wall biosynthesis
MEGKSEMSCNEECRSIVKKQIELLEILEERIKQLDKVLPHAVARTEETATGSGQEPAGSEADIDLMKKLHEKETESLKLICDARLKVINEQKMALDNIRRWRLRERFKQALSPKIGVLYHHDPIPLNIPKRYLSVPALKSYPIISVVTPSFNHADFIERTINSVLGQNYPNLEYIIQDGGSDDGTIEILKQVAPALKRWESVKDTGQSNAINLGFRHATGEIMAYLNSDDLLLPGALHYVADYFVKHPEVDVVYGHRVLIDEYDRETGRWVLPPNDNTVLSWADYVPQETLFWRRSIWDRTGSCIDESFRFAMDWELIIRFRDAGARFVRLPRFLGAFRVHAHQKTSAQMAEVGQKEMGRLRERCHGKVVSDGEIDENIKWYLIKHVLCNAFYRVGIFKY